MIEPGDVKGGVHVSKGGVHLLGPFDISAVWIATLEIIRWWSDAQIQPYTLSLLFYVSDIDARVIAEPTWANTWVFQPS